MSARVVRLVWEPSVEASTDGSASGVDHYVVYRQDAPNAVIPVSTVPHVEGASLVTWDDAPAPLGRWYYRVLAVDRAGNRSPWSAEVSALVEPAGDVPPAARRHVVLRVGVVPRVAARASLMPRLVARVSVSPRLAGRATVTFCGSRVRSPQP